MDSILSLSPSTNVQILRYLVNPKFSLCFTPHSLFGKSVHKHRRLSLGIDEGYRLTFDCRFSALSQCEIRVHWWKHNSKNPMNLGRREFNLTLHQSPHGFATQNKSTRARDPASYAGYSDGRALHRYHRGEGFESRSGLSLFQALISQLLIHVHVGCVYNCDDQ